MELLATTRTWVHETWTAKTLSCLTRSQPYDYIIFHVHETMFHYKLPPRRFLSRQLIATNDLGVDKVCVNSDPLIGKVNSPITAFANQLRKEAKQPSALSEAFGTIRLEFAVHRKATWNLGSEASVWERWSITLHLKPIAPAAREQHRRQLEQAVRDGLLKVLEAVNTPDVYTPSLGSSQTETEHIIDFDLPDISPYRFGISFTVSAS
ncbi:hypothetical protein D915_007930 [Fasciola hepatica]|uniref:Autophagy-related protein 101 n=1 Tax=Fasciola hepatica TaxID=6192 RepID=A0A4E0R4M6_FASHE|nr:hypothetical protein D915_007930 [Fasciola hepatica]